MGKKFCCNCRCIYFPQEPDKILKEKVKDGVKYRIVERRCLFDNSLINSWKKQCPRKDGPLIREK